MIFGEFWSGTMNDDRIIFNDGAAYDRIMGRWSQIAGKVFLDWLAMPTCLRWLDVGCGNPLGK